MYIDDAKNLMAKLLEDHGLSQKGWKITLGRSWMRFGYCWHPEKIINISKYFIKYCTRAELKDLMIHEISHAILPGKIGHGPRWKKLCIKLGGSGTRLINFPRKYPPGTWKSECPTCDKIYYRYRKPKKGRRWCEVCGPIWGKLKFAKIQGVK